MFFFKKFQTALHKASAEGDFDLVQLLISAALTLYGEGEVKNMLQEVDLDHNTPLWLGKFTIKMSIITTFGHKLLNQKFH